MIERQLISMKKVAESLGVTSQHVRNLVLRGEMPTVKVGARYMFKPNDIEKFIDNNYNQIKGAY